jgi:prevent-host-death family protein
MSESMITIEDAARCLQDLVERVHACGEPAVLTKSGRPLARIVPVLAPGQIADDLIAFLRRWRLEHPDADEQFAQAIQESRKAVQPLTDPWA